MAIFRADHQTASDFTHIEGRERFLDLVVILFHIGRKAVYSLGQEFRERRRGAGCADACLLGQLADDLWPQC